VSPICCHLIHKSVRFKKQPPEKCMKIQYDQKRNLAVLSKGYESFISSRSQSHLMCTFTCTRMQPTTHKQNRGVFFWSDSTLLCRFTHLSFTWLTASRLIVHQWSHWNFGLHMVEAALELSSHSRCQVWGKTCVLQTSFILSFIFLQHVLEFWTEFQMVTSCGVLPFYHLLVTMQCILITCKVYLHNGWSKFWLNKW